MRFPSWATILVLAIFLALIPLFRPSVYMLSFLSLLLMYAALATSWNIAGGYTGYLSFGHVAFFGVGGYTTALLLIAFKWSPLWTSWLGGLLAALFATLVGYPCLRLHGPYFSLVTLILALAVKVIVLNMRWTGGSSGLWIPLPPWDTFTTRVIFFEAMVFLLAFVLLVARATYLGKIGKGLTAIRENEIVAQAIGINTTYLKMVAFITSAFLTGVIGGLYSYMQNYIHPDMMFDPTISVFMVLMALFGGAKTWFGPLIGAATLRVVDEILTLSIQAEMARILFGLILAGVVLFMPDGLSALVVQSVSKLKKVAAEKVG
jgi:branched-chain amino acid transport system permease protein